MKFNTNRLGDMTELAAALWLADQGYEVFPNFGCSGPVDLIALDPETGKIMLIDVKTCRIYDTNDKPQPGPIKDRPSPLQDKLGVMFLYVDRGNGLFCFDGADMRAAHIRILAGTVD